MTFMCPVMLLLATLAPGLVSGAPQTTAAEAIPTMIPKFRSTIPGTFHPVGPPMLFVGPSLARSDVQSLVEDLKTPLGAPAAAAAPTTLPRSGYVLAGTGSDHPALRKLMEFVRTHAPKEGLGSEGFALDVSPERILLLANSSAGLSYAARCLAEISAGQTGILAGITIDRPTMAWRGMHVNIGGHGDMGSLEEIIAHQMPALRLNRLILEIDYGFQYRSHPEMNDPDGLTVADCKRLRELADRNHIELIPMINCLGHQSWAAETGALLKKHPEFDETPDYPADNKGIYCRSWCPSNPAVVPFVCDLADELIDAFGAKSFHVGMDEVFILGNCPRCQGKDNAALFAKAVNDLHAHIVGKRKLKMYMWGDRLLDGKAMNLGEWEASQNGTYPAIDRIPHDIVMCDWHYETHYGGKAATFPSVPYFQEKGFAVVPSGWNREENVRLLTNVALTAPTPRMLGYLATTWVGAGPVAEGLRHGAGAKIGKEGENLPASIRLGARIAWEGRSAKPNEPSTPAKGENHE